MLGRLPVPSSPGSGLLLSLTLHTLASRVRHLSSVGEGSWCCGDEDQGLLGRKCLSGPVLTPGLGRNK